MSTNAELLALEEAVRRQPNNAGVFLYLAIAQFNTGLFDAAAQSINASIRLDPNNASAHNFLGIALARQGQHTGAIESFRQAILLDPNYGDAHGNLGITLVEQGMFVVADECFRQALRINAGNRLTLYNQSLLRLLQGDFAGGWPGYEHRWAQPGKVPRHYSQPQWDGAPLDGKTIFVYPEQGFGDTLQFVRYLPLVQERGGKIVFECQGELADLLARFPGVDQLIVAGQVPPPFDVHTPLLSLPGIFGTTPTSIPADVPYLQADSALCEYWRHALASLPGFKVGISWQGNPTFRGDRTRSMPLHHFEKLARVPGVQLVSLQKGAGLEQLPAFASQHSIVDLSKKLTTFADTAAVMMNLDLIVSSCTAIPHLAGALGRQVWTLLQFVPDWRWHLDRSDSPWYPTMRLFRQGRPGDWEDVFERAASVLALDANHNSS